MFNVLAGGLIIGNANTGTNQKYAGYLEFDLELTASTTYTIELDWTATAINLEAAIHSGEIKVEQKTIT